MAPRSQKTAARVRVGEVVLEHPCGVVGSPRSSLPLSGGDEGRGEGKSRHVLAFGSPVLLAFGSLHGQNVPR